MPARFWERFRAPARSARGLDRGVVFFGPLRLARARSALFENRISRVRRADRSALNCTVGRTVLTQNECRVAEGQRTQSEAQQRFISASSSAPQRLRDRISSIEYASGKSRFTEPYKTRQNLTPRRLVSTRKIEPPSTPRAPSGRQASTYHGALGGLGGSIRSLVSTKCPIARRRRKKISSGSKRKPQNHRENKGFASQAGVRKEIKR